MPTTRRPPLTTSPPDTAPRPSKPAAQPPESSAARAGSSPVRRSPAGKATARPTKAGAPRPEPPTRQGGSSKAEPKPKSPASHFLLAERIHKLVAGEAIPPLPGDYYLMLPQREESYLPSGIRVGKGHPQTTANYQTMAIVAELVRLWRSGAPPLWIPLRVQGEYFDFTRQRAVNLLNEELTRGLMRSEQLAVSPHDELHLAPMALLRLAAFDADDQQIIELSDMWWVHYLTVVAACITPNGVLCHAGARSRGNPTSEVGSAIYAEITKNVPLREPGKESTALTAIRKSLARGDIFAGARRNSPELGYFGKAMSMLSRVKLLYPMVVEYYDDRIISYIPTPAPDFYLRNLFASYVEVQYGRERSANQLVKAGKLRVIKGWSEPIPKANRLPTKRAITS